MIGYQSQRHHTMQISNYRIRVNSDPKTQSFVSAGVSIGGKKSEQRMICENIFTPYKFMNIGGQVRLKPSIHPSIHPSTHEKSDLCREDGVG